MPSDEKHVRIGVVVCCLLLLPMIFFGVSYGVIIAFASAYIFATMYLSPDLDINSRPYQRWGVLRFLWYPYMKVFKHRQASHNLLIGPVSVVLYLALIVVPVVCGILYMWIPIVTYLIDYVQQIELTRENGILVAIVVAGFIVSGWTHILADKMMKGERQG